MSRQESRRFPPLSFSLGTVMFVIFLWWLLTHLGKVPAILVPSPGQVWNAFVQLAWGSGYKGHSLWAHLGISLARIGIAFGAAVVTAVPLGLLAGYNRTVYAILAPLVHFIRPLPPLAYYTILIIWLGIGEMSKLSLLFLAGFAPIFLAAVSAVEGIDPARLKAGRTLGATGWKEFLYLIIPSALPEVFTGLRTALGFIYTTLVAAEMVAASSGIGWMVLDASKFLQSDVIFAGIIVMGITAILIDSGFRLFEKWLVPWKGKGE